MEEMLREALAPARERRRGNAGWFQKVFLENWLLKIILFFASTLLFYVVLEIMKILFA